MKNSEVVNLAPGIDWVGILDFGIVTFDVVMETRYGTTYNSYVVKGNDKVALIETAKATFFDEYIEKVKAVVDPAQIDYLVLDHTEPDHSKIDFGDDDEEGGNLPDEARELVPELGDGFEDAGADFGEDSGEDEF